MAKYKSLKIASYAIAAAGALASGCASTSKNALNYPTFDELKKTGRCINSENIKGTVFYKYDTNKDKLPDYAYSKEFGVEPTAVVPSTNSLNYAVSAGIAVGNDYIASLNLYLKSRGLPEVSGSVLADKDADIGAAFGVFGRTDLYNLGLGASAATINGATAFSAGINADLFKGEKYAFGAGVGAYKLDNSRGAYVSASAIRKLSKKMCGRLEGYVTSNDGVLVGLEIRSNFGQDNDSFFSRGFARTPVAGSLLSLNEEKTKPIEPPVEPPIEPPKPPVEPTKPKPDTPEEPPVEPPVIPNSGEIDFGDYEFDGQ